MSWCASLCLRQGCHYTCDNTMYNSLHAFLQNSSKWVILFTCKALFLLFIICLTICIFCRSRFIWRHYSKHSEVEYCVNIILTVLKLMAPCCHQKRGTCGGASVAYVFLEHRGTYSTAQAFKRHWNRAQDPVLQFGSVDTGHTGTGNIGNGFRYPIWEPTP